MKGQVFYESVTETRKLASYAAVRKLMHRNNTARPHRTMMITVCPLRGQQLRVPSMFHLLFYIQYILQLVLSACHI